MAEALGGKMSVKNERRALVFATIDDLVGNFLYYGRKEDEDLPRGVIEKMFEDGEITTQEIVQRFGNELCAALIRSK
jgi:hypothetical protein